MPPWRPHAPCIAMECEYVPSLHCADAPTESCAAFSSALIALASAFFAAAAAAAAFSGSFEAFALTALASALAALRAFFAAAVATKSTPPCPEHAPRPVPADVEPSRQTDVFDVFDCAPSGATTTRKTTKMRDPAETSPRSRRIYDLHEMDLRIETRPRPRASSEHFQRLRCCAVLRALAGTRARRCKRPRRVLSPDSCLLGALLVLPPWTATPGNCRSDVM